MKISLAFYLFMVTQLIAHTARSQNKISINLKDEKLSSVLKYIEDRSTFNFIYNNDDIDDAKRFSIKENDKTINKILDRLFKGSDITFKIRKEHIILAKKPTVYNSPQAEYTISGTVKDAETGETLLGATISVKDTSRGVVTNEYGFYSITLPSKSYVLVVSYIGYLQKEIPIELNKDQKLIIELSPTSNELDEVVILSDLKVKSQVKTILNGTVSLNTAEIKQLPSLLGEPDVIRAILTQPGVATVGEGATGFNVRGGNIDQNLILLDEAPVYNSSHLWGFFSIFNADAIKNLKLYKGGIPARFGSRASSVLDIRQREGSNKKFKGEGGLGLLFSKLTLEGPIKKEKLSYLVSGRRSYFDLFFPLMGDDVKNNKVYFYDLNTKLSWNINQNNKLFASGYFGADVMKLNFEGETLANGTKEDDDNVDFRWKNATATLRWNHIFSENLFLNTSVIYSRYNYGLSSNDNTAGGTSATGAFLWKSAVENWIFKPDFTLYSNSNTKIRFGAHNTLYIFSPANVKSKESGINSIDLEKEKGLEIAPYVEYEREWGQLSINAGLRYSWFGNLGPYTVSEYNLNLPKTTSSITKNTTYKKGKVIKNYSGFEPRLALKYNLNDRKAFKLGYNRMFQYIHLISNTYSALPFDIWKPSGPHVKPLEVNQFSAGYAYDTPDRSYNFSIEGYYKTFNNIVEYKNGANLFINKNIETEMLNANGYAYGLELGAYKNKGKLTGNINYTYSVSKRKTVSNFPSENVNGGAYYPSNYDRPHLINITGNYRLGKKWELGTFFTYQTGRPITQVTGRLTDRDSNTSYFTYSNRNAYRIPDTHRLDLSFTYTPDNKARRWQGSWSFGVYNVYANENAFSVYSTFNNNKKVKTYQFSVIGAPIPFITYNFKF
ncbi:TonB-dependent receptor [Aestuariivivens insulae]|uniref:TonB-dependent receptor n=1 Tax=Aestuariivivens insulae TaxID=1621988 RepID=UPI001F593185|nr:TonB-dependent receptor [Aestuariivivens insulae]